MKLPQCHSCILGVESPNLDLRPNPGPELLPPELSWEAYLILCLVGVAALLAAAVVWRWLRRPRAAPAIPPGEWALAELRHIESNGEDLEARYARAGDVLRHFLWARFQLHAPVRTTPEFLRVLKASESLSDEHKSGVADILSRADLVKFARAKPTADDAGRFLDAVRTLIRRLASLQ